MSLETFEKILDDIGDVLIAVYLFCFGEPFMNKDVIKMFEACTARNILTLTSTNGHFIQTLDEALKVVDAGLKTLVIAVDGSTQEIYQKYRVSGDIEKVKRFITLIEEAKVRRKSQYPYTALRCVVTRENQDDLPNLEKLAGELGVNMFTYKTLGCMTQDEKYREYEPSTKDMKRFEYAGSSRVSGSLIQCPFPVRQPIIFCDGTVVGCEFDSDLVRAFGKIGRQSFREIWNSPNAIELRRSIRTKCNRPAFCINCPYQDGVRRGTQLLNKELRPLNAR
jgi:radical SAM protein with 4Fe4S-binding SPASM domain